MDSRFAQIASLAQKDRAPAYISILTDLYARPDQTTLAADIHALVENVLQESVGIVVARQVLAELVKSLGDGTVKDSTMRKRIVEETLELIQPGLVSYEEQVNSLRFQLADILEAEEEWIEAARVLMGISLDAGQRPDEEKLRVYVRIVRLLLEEEDSVQAETYYNRAASLAHTTSDRETLLQFKLCQARISDYARKFLEAATRYHELSWVAEIDEDERKHMLSAAVTCAVLAPAGPNRSRVLASLCRDERTAELPSFNILSKMFLDRILRSSEINEFRDTLKTHQLAKIALSSNDRLASAAVDDESANDPNVSKRTGPSTVLDRAVMEHNLLASSKIYNNITFRGLGALLDVTPGAAETMARKMIEQGRLKGTIDQVEKLIWFDVDGEEDDAQGKAGGLGDVEQATEDTGAPFTKRWDMQIRLTGSNVESIVQHLTEKGLVRFASAQA
ncbi:26S Proteasome non-ATPase regulatory subunit 12/COP9 signalosome complex subunit 4 [Abortiporus biennis]